MTLTRAQQVVITFVGFLFIALGAYFLKAEMAESVVHTKHVYVFAGLMVLGGAFIFPTLILSLLKTLADRLPTFKFGSRTGDVPLEKAPVGTQPGTPVADVAEVVVARSTDPKPGDA